MENKGRDFEHFEDNRDLRTAQEASSSPQNTSFRRGSRRLDVPAEEMEKYFNITPNAESADGKLALLPENNLVPRVNGIAEAQLLEAAVQHASALPTTNLSPNETFPSSAFPGESSAISGAHPATTAGLLRTEEAGLPAHEWVSSASIEPHVSNGAALAVHSTPEAHTGTAHIPSAEVKAGVKAEQSFIQSLGRYASEAGAMVSKHSGKTAIATGLLTAASFAIPNAEQQVIAADGTQTTEQRASFGKKTLITVGSLMTAALAADLLPGATKGWVGRVLENQGAQKAILG